MCMFTQPSIKRFIVKMKATVLQGEKGKMSESFIKSSNWYTYHPPQKRDYPGVLWMDELLLA